MTTATAVKLPHTGMTVPYAGLRAVAVKTLPTFDGTAFQARVAFNDEYAGIIENDGGGGATSWTTANAKVFGPRDMENFVDGCVGVFGERLAHETVFNNLRYEREGEQEVAQRIAEGGTPVRVMVESFISAAGDQHSHVDAYSAIAGLEWAQPSTWGTLADIIWNSQLVRELYADVNIVSIDVWTGTSWESLARPAGQPA